MSNIVVPQLGESVVEARVARWLKKEGDRVETGEPIVELETEKIDLEVGAEHGGVLTTIKAKEGEDVKVGDLLAVVDESAAGNGAGAKAAAPAKAEEAKPRAAAAAAAAPQITEAPKSTPTARKMAKDLDVNIGHVQGTGAAGRVTKDDVRKAVGPQSSPSVQASSPSVRSVPESVPTVARRPAGDRSETRSRMTKRRATIARRLVEAQHTAAMLTTFNEIDMTEVMALRERKKESFKKQWGVNLGFTSFFTKASIAALRAFPQLNAEIQGDEIVLKHYYDIGIAVGAEGGLVVPVLRDAEQMSFAEIELGVRDFAARAKESALTLEDLKGGTFTITNGGVFGSLMSTPILNPPQVAILGLHKIEDRAVPRNGQVVIRPMMYVAVSYDHRIVDGREAVQFLVKIKECIEDPGNLLLES
jgi:2-oxoglutarate dehydrogenase E2 component (dihydrolipoamide succinyltransferase)